jgi:hypothetical protein
MKENENKHSIRDNIYIYTQINVIGVSQKKKEVNRG